MDTLLRDLRHAVRQLARQRAFTLTAVATLALGIGANTAMFGIVHGVLLRPLPWPDAEAIVRVGESFGGRGRGAFLSNRSMALLQENAESFEQIAAYRAAAVDWAGPDGAVTLRGARVSPSLFPLLRAAPHLGRLFTEEEGRAGADRAVLLGHGAWTNRFGADPDIVGAAVDLGGDPYTVVGVLAEGFYFPNPDGEFWMPFVVPPFTPPTLDPSGRFTVSVVAFSALGRLAPGVSPTQAATEAGAILQRDDDGFFAMRGGGVDPASDGAPAVEARVVPLLEQMVGGYRPALLALTGATLLVLLIACSNVAGLLLARGVTRQRALAVSAALGAGRGRLVRQLLTESVVLSLLGGALGLVAAAVVVRAVPALVPGNVARLDQVAVHGVALAFNLGLSVVVGLLFGAAPALQWSRLDLVRTLNEGSGQSAGGFRLLRSNRIRAALATGQVALALVLLVGAGLLLRSFVGLVTADRGYDAANVVTAVTRNPDFRQRAAGMTPGESGRGPRREPALPGRARRSGDEARAPAGRRGGGGDVARPPRDHRRGAAPHAVSRGRPPDGWQCRRHPPGFGAGRQPRLSRGDARAPPRRAPPDAPRPRRQPARRRPERDPRATALRGRAGRRRAGAVRPVG